ncbi:MAG: BadF/BadG/BcrA/BcrD ATPase family protein [Bacteroidota bacterium]|jgi:N-acetylglucosamine kinase-like BadF-type ATPase
MNKPLYVIGIEGGGTKTTAVLCALDSIILSEAQGGPSNFHIVGIEKTVSTLLDLIQTCCHSVGCSVSQIGAVVAGLAGAGRVLDQQRIIDRLLELAHMKSLNLEKVSIESDARIALEGAFSGKPGVVVISGTGSIVFGKDEHDKVYRAGGWGRFIGDEGSGYAIGREAFRAVAKCLDGYGEKTKLVKLFDEKFGLGTQDAIIDAIYGEKYDFPSVVPMVIEAASKGDPVAKRILIRACSDLVEVIDTVLLKMNKGKKGVPKRPLAFVGSLLMNDNLYSHKMRSVIKREVPLASLRNAEVSPVVGAALMAIQLLNE